MQENKIVQFFSTTQCRLRTMQFYLYLTAITCNIVCQLFLLVVFCIICLNAQVHLCTCCYRPILSNIAWSWYNTVIEGIRGAFCDDALYKLTFTFTIVFVIRYVGL